MDTCIIHCKNSTVTFVNQRNYVLLIKQSKTNIFFLCFFYRFNQTKQKKQNQRKNTKMNQKTKTKIKIQNKKMFISTKQINTNAILLYKIMQNQNNFKRKQKKLQTTIKQNKKSEQKTKIWL